MNCPVCSAPSPSNAASCLVCGADLTPLAPGSVVAGRYEVHALLGQGGMAAVYRAGDRVLHEDVALKIQRAGLTSDPEAERRWLSEVKLARQVSHPNVCRLHDGGQDGPRRFIAMELVEGETLAARLRARSISPEEAWDLAIQAADGLAAVHGAGVVHRDLKAANVMVDPQGRLRLMDFGIARPAVGGDSSSGACVQGSPEYMSPEQARGQPADIRSDVYSLGIVLFEMLTRTVPFRGNSPVATLLLQLQAEPPLERVPAPWRGLIARALSKDPARRFADGAAMAQALRAVRDARIPTSTVSSLRARARWRGVAVAVTVLVLSFVIAIALRLAPSGPLPAAPEAQLLAAKPPATPSSPAAVGPTVSPAPAPGDLSSGAGFPRGRHPAEGGTESLRNAGGPARAAPSQGPADAPAAEPSAASTEPTPPASPARPAPGPMATPLADTASSLPPTEPGPAPTTAEEPGALLVIVRPWADVTVDGVLRGQTPLGRIPLAPGPHAVLLAHPDYQPYPRRLVIEPGQTQRLVVNLATEGVRRRR